MGYLQPPIRRIIDPETEWATACEILTWFLFVDNQFGLPLSSSAPSKYRAAVRLDARMPPHQIDKHWSDDPTVPAPIWWEWLRQVRREDVGDFFRNIAGLWEAESAERVDMKTITIKYVFFSIL